MEKSVTVIARRVIDAEKEAIQGLLAQLDGDFERVIHLLQKIKGRVVISGIGKSAIIAQKLVATFNSTGTAATFLHAADAIHGDLGMIQPEDVALMISHSGESAEIKVLAPLVKSSCTALIALVGNEQSFLAKNSDLVLCTGTTKEACPNNLAPTSSTTAQLVMGDAMAICLMELKGFQAADFARLHPGGDLGRKLNLRVSDLYEQNARPSVALSADWKTVIFEISKGRLGATAVTDAAQKVIGIITDGDVRRMLEHTDQLNGIEASDIYTADPKCIHADMLAMQAMELIKKYDVGQLVVSGDNGEYLGILHIHDLIRAGIY